MFEMLIIETQIAPKSHTLQSLSELRRSLYFVFGSSHHHRSHRSNRFYLTKLSCFFKQTQLQASLFVLISQRIQHQFHIALLQHRNHHSISHPLSPLLTFFPASAVSSPPSSFPAPLSKSTPHRPHAHRPASPRPDTVHCEYRRPAHR